MSKNKKIYFASDQHLGAPDYEKSKIRELKFIRWLDHVKKDARAIFLLGDLFDFWFEYKTVVPKGFTRVLGKLAEIRDLNIPIYFFVGNHDLWMHNYFEKELNIPVYHNPKEFTFNGKTFLIGHGDGLGPGDYNYKRVKKLFTNPIAKWLFRWLHPDIGVALAQKLSLRNKLISGKQDAQYQGGDKEWLVCYSKKVLKTKHYHYFVFGHRHLPINLKIGDTSEYINLGDWISHFTYGVFDGEKMAVMPFEEKNL